MIISDGINHGKLQSIIVGELKKAGLKHRLKKIIFKSVKDHKAVFGAPLFKVPSTSVICCGSTLSVPLVVSEMSAVLRANVHVEGLFRKAGSQSRQKDIRRLLDAGGCVSEGHHPIDVASVFKLYLRCLPEPLISAEVQDLLLRCRITAGDDAIKPILHTLLLLPVLHIHLLHYIMELLSYIAAHAPQNRMDASNLAIVLTPSVMPLPAAATAQRLDHHVALVKLMIENAPRIGLLTAELMSQLDEDSDAGVSRRKKRRSGSLNRMLSGLRKMVSGSVQTPAAVRELATPVLSKSTSKRKYDANDGLSAKTKKTVKEHLPQKELSFTPMKMGMTERKRLRLSMMEARSTPVINSDQLPSITHQPSETSLSSEDLLTSSERLFHPHDTIDLSPENKRDKDYVRISKQEYEEIKSRVSAIENRLSREFTDVIPRVQPLQQVQNVYEQTLEEVAMLHCPTSDHLARRLSKELKIRPNEQAKVIRSPSARKIGTIRRRSKENLTKIVRHKSWNASSHSQASQQSDRFYPFVGLSRRSSTKPDAGKEHAKPSDWNSSSDNSFNNSYNNQKYQLRKRTSLSSDCNLDKTIARPTRRPVTTVNNNSWDATTSENSFNNTLNSSEKSNCSDKAYYVNVRQKSTAVSKGHTPHSQQKWRSAAAFFMEKTGEVDNTNQTGRPSVNKLRKQNAGAVLAKAKLFESSSDKSSEIHDKNHVAFARKPKINSINQKKQLAQVKPKIQVTTHKDTNSPRSNIPDVVPTRNYRIYLGGDKVESDSWRNRKNSPIKKVVSPQSKTPALKKSLCTPRTVRAPGTAMGDVRKTNTPLKAVHTSPRRRSPRQKPQRAYN